MDLESRPSGSYQYDLLDTSTRSTRLLNILPLAKDGTVRLALRNVTLDHLRDSHHDQSMEQANATTQSLGDYSALSYMWGSVEKQRHVRINGKAMFLRENLCCFLLHCSTTPALLAKLGRNLWIDAICINQEDISEKNHQVRQMSYIYSNARQVVIWLGETSRSSGSLAQCFTVQDDFLSADPKRPPFHFRVAYHEELDDVDEAALEVLQSVLANPYWDRLWIVPEVCLAVLPHFVSGEDLISLHLVKELVNFGSDSPRITEPMSAGAKAILEIVSDRAPIMRRDLATLAARFHGHQCLDPRDHNYALLGFVEDGDTFNVDYSSTEECLFLETLSFCHERRGSKSQPRRTTQSTIKIAHSLMLALGVNTDGILAQASLRNRLSQQALTLQLECKVFLTTPNDEMDTKQYYEAYYQEVALHYSEIERLSMHERTPAKRYAGGPESKMLKRWTMVEC